MTPAHRLTLAAAILAADVPEDARLEALALLVGAAPAAPAQELPADPVERRRVLRASRNRAYRERLAASRERLTERLGSVSEASRSVSPQALASGVLFAPALSAGISLSSGISAEKTQIQNPEGDPPGTPPVAPTASRETLTETLTETRDARRETPPEGTPPARSEPVTMRGSVDGPEPIRATHYPPTGLLEPTPAGGPPRRQKRAKSPQQLLPLGDVETVWTAYLEGRATRTTMGHAPTLTAARADLIKRRLKDHTVDQLADACRGVWLSDWNVEGGHTSLELALRDAGKVERYAAVGARGQRLPANVTPIRNGRGGPVQPLPEGFRPQTVEEWKADQLDPAKCQIGGTKWAF